MRLFRIALTIALAIFIIDGTASATTFQEVTMDATSTYYPWNESDNWTAGIPAAGIQAVIPTGLTATVDTASDIAGYLDIQGTGAVVIQAGAKLTLDGDGTARTSSIAASARIYLEGSGAELAVIDDDHTLLGYGKVVGQHDDARITVTAGETLTNYLAAVDPSTAGITGHLEMSGAGSFTNQGIVNADTSGTLLVNVSGTLDDSSSGQWRASAASSLLEFGNALDDPNAALALVGDFFITHASAEIQIDEMTGYTGAAPFFLTTGHLEMSGGTLDIDENTQMGSEGESASITGGQIVVAPGMAFTHH